MKDTADTSLTLNIFSLHGFTGSGLDFDLLKTSIQAYLDGVSVRLNWLSPSLPGHGESSEEDCSIEGHYDFLIQYIKANVEKEQNLGTHKNILIAYSMGSRLGLLHATRQTDFWDAIILIGLNPGIRSKAERTLRFESDQELANKIGDYGIPWFLEYWKALPLISTQSKAPDDFEQVMHKRKESLNIKGLQNSLVQFGQGVFPDLWNSIHGIQSPILLINGKMDDKYCEISRQFSGVHSNTHCEVIKDCGHAPHIERSNPTAQSIATFLKKRIL